MPLVIYHQVEAKQLKAVGQGEEGQLPTDCIKALPCKSPNADFCLKAQRFEQGSGRCQADLCIGKSMKDKAQADESGLRV